MENREMEILNKMDFNTKVFYLAMAGWRIELETRNGQEHLFAIRYNKGKKERIDLEITSWKLSVRPFEKGEKKTWKTRSAIPLDEEKLSTMNFRDRVITLAISGYKIVLEKRGSNEYYYAIRYIDRKKRRIYVGTQEDYLPYSLSFKLM